MYASDKGNASFFQVIRESVQHNIRQYTMIIALLGIWAVFSILTEFVFLTPVNISNLFVQSAVTAILAIGMTLVIVTGHIDLSVGSVMGFTGALAAVLMIEAQIPAAFAILLTLGAGVAIGAWHGMWVSRMQLPAFIVTLASMLMFKGGILLITQGQTKDLNMAARADAAVFKTIGGENLPRLFGDGLPFHDLSLLLAVLVVFFFVFMEIRKRRSRISHGFTVDPRSLFVFKLVSVSLLISALFSFMIFYRGIPNPVLLVMLVGLLFAFIAQKTTFGRHLYAIGGNKEAAALSGINIRARTLTLFMIMGALAALAGILQTGRSFSASTSAGQNMELDAIAACVIGGTSLMGGQGTIFGAITGALVMASLDSGMSLMGVDVSWQYIIKGLILLLAVWADIATRNKG